MKGIPIGTDGQFIPEIVARVAFHKILERMHARTIAIGELPDARLVGPFVMIFKEACTFTFDVATRSIVVKNALPVKP